MTASGLVPLLCVAILSLGAQAPVFRTGVDFVVVDASVRQGDRPVAGLGSSDFEIRDNGTVQTVRDVSFESSPIEVTLAVDLSGSVSGRLLEAIGRAVDRVAATLRPTDRVHLVTFNQAAHERPIPPAGSGALLSSVLGSPHGTTSLFDALVATLIRPREPTFRSMAVLLTDGEDNMSFLDPGTALEVVRRADPSLFVVGFVDQGTSFQILPFPNRSLFDAMTQLTGGKLTVLGTAEDISDAFVQAVSAFRSSYVLRYIPDNGQQPGWHTVAVRVLREGRFEVRARQGYFVGPTSER